MYVGLIVPFTTLSFAGKFNLHKYYKEKAVHNRKAEYEIFSYFFMNAFEFCG